MAKTGYDALISVGQLDKVAKAYEQTAQTLRKLAKGLKSVLEAAETTVSDTAAPARKTRKRKMSAEQRRALSEAARKRWADKKGQVAA